MIPIDFKVNSSKIKATVAFNLMIHRPNQGYSDLRIKDIYPIPCPDDN